MPIRKQINIMLMRVGLNTKVVFIVL